MLHCLFHQARVTARILSLGAGIALLLVAPQALAEAPEQPTPEETQLSESGGAPQLDSNQSVALPEQSDERFAKNSIYVEGLGAGLLYSINYERVIEDAVAARIGISYLSVSATARSGDTVSEASSTVMFFPIGASYIGIDGLELGGGATLMYASGSASTIGAESSGSGISPLGHLLVGYRSHPDIDGGFHFRVGAMALMGPGLGLSVEDPEAFGVLPYAYLSLGASF